MSPRKLTSVFVYATLELIENRIDKDTLAKQMGNSAVMIERHYSKITVTMATEILSLLE